MYARFFTSQTQPGQVEEVARITRDSIIPAMQQQPGNRGGTLAVDRQTGKLAFASYWETAADRDQTGEGTAYLKEALAQVTPLFTGAMSIESYEVSILEGVREGSYIRLTTARIRPDRLPQALTLLRDAAQTVRQQPGNTAALALTDAQTGKIRIGTVWATEADRAAFQSGGAAEKQRSRFADLLAEPLGPAEHFEAIVRA